MTLDALLLRYRFDLDYVCASCGRRFALDEHDFAACSSSASWQPSRQAGIASIVDLDRIETK